MRLHLLLVTFALRNPNKDYSDFFVSLRGNSINWWHFIEQTTIVTARMDADEFAHKLYPHMEVADSLLVFEVDVKRAQGWLPKMAWDWLVAASENVSKEKTAEILASLAKSNLPPGRE